MILALVIDPHSTAEAERRNVSSMGIVLDTMKVFPLEIVIMAVIFVISVLPTVICTLNMSKKDGVAE